jgi:hypothetical protein
VVTVKEKIKKALDKMSYGFIPEVVGHLFCVALMLLGISAVLVTLKWAWMAITSFIGGF